MGFYNSKKEDRKKIVQSLAADIQEDIAKRSSTILEKYFTDDDTYIRKAAYEAVGKIHKKDNGQLDQIIKLLDELSTHDDSHVRQSVINAAGEIGKINFGAVQRFFDDGLNDAHHAPRNAVIGSLKKMGEVNPVPILAWAKGYLHHPDKEIRREICHGIELRGRTHPEDILPLLKELEHDKTARVRNTLVHVLGQISYKKGCLAKVVLHLKTWDNTALVKDALDEIIDVHHRYKDFSALTAAQAKNYIRKTIK